VVIFLRFRRFRCLAPACPKQAFAGQVPLSGRLAAAVSRTTLIPLIRAMPDLRRDVAPAARDGGPRMARYSE
jgi:hypothetical protein